MEVLNEWDVTQQIADAILRNEKEIEIKGVKISLPAGQGQGTYTQKRTYAILKGQELFKRVHWFYTNKKDNE